MLRKLYGLLIGLVAGVVAFVLTTLAIAVTTDLAWHILGGP